MLSIMKNKKILWDPLYGNLAGVLVMSAALLVFVGAMAINRRISDIRV